MNDDLRKLAEETATSVAEGFYGNPPASEEQILSVLAALQSVQRAEREKAEGLREALIRLQNHSESWLEVEDICSEALAAYDSATNSAETQQPDPKPVHHACVFCGEQERLLIAKDTEDPTSPAVCDYCVELCAEIVNEEK